MTDVGSPQLQGAVNPFEQNSSGGNSSSLPWVIADPPTGNAAIDTAGLRANIVTCQATGQELILRAGIYAAFSATNPIFAITKPFNIRGAGMTASNGAVPRSIISVDAATPNTVDVFSFAPALAGDGDYFEWSGFAIRGNNAARNGIRLDATAAGRYMRGFTIKQVLIEACAGGDGIQMDASGGVGLGLFLARIIDCPIAGSAGHAAIQGIQLFDSVKIEDCTLGGSGYSFLGSFFPGASNFTFRGNTCVGSSGFRTTGADIGALIEDNYFEQQAAFTGPNGAMVDFDAATFTTINQLAFIRNTVAALAVAVDGVRLKGTVDAYIGGNNYIQVPAGRTHIVITAASSGTVRGTNRLVGAGAAISNASVSTTHPEPTLLVSSIANSSAIANTAVATVFDRSFTIPAGTLEPGDVIEVEATGIYSTTGAPALTIEGLIGGFVFTGNTLATVIDAANVMWTASVKAVVQSVGAGGIFRSGGGTVGINSVVTFSPLQLATAINTAAGIACQVRATWGTASASNTITMQSFLVKVWRAGVTI